MTLQNILKIVKILWFWREEFTFAVLDDMQ